MSEETGSAPKAIGEPKGPPLAHRKIQVIAVAVLLAGMFLYDMGNKQFGWPPFHAVGLAVNAGVVYAVLLHVYPLAAIAISLIMLLLASFIGDTGYWLSGISVIVYFLTAFEPRKKTSAP